MIFNSCDYKFVYAKEWGAVTKGVGFAGKIDFAIIENAFLLLLLATFFEIRVFAFRNSSTNAICPPNF
jgi:hypothetical protein